MSSTQLHTPEEVERLRDLFDAYDTDGSGEISIEELHGIVGQMIDNKMSAMIIVDVSSDLWK